MTDRAKFEQMLEYLINEDRAKAEEIFHDIVVAKSREIYESLLDDEMSEAFPEHGDGSDDFADEVSDDDETSSEFDGFGDESDDDEGGFGLGDEDDGEFGDEDAGEFGDEGDGDEPVTKDDLTDALEELKAEFEALLSGEDSDEEDEHDWDSEEKEEDEEESEDDEDEDYENESYVREYVEKQSLNWEKDHRSEQGVNPKSIVAGKNDMGGTAKNLVQGDSADTKGTSGGLQGNKPKDINSGNINVPGGKAGKSAFKSSAPGAKPMSSNKGEQSVNGTSIIGKRVR